MPMLNGALALIAQTLAGFFTMMLLVRAVMRFMRISFVGQLGQFVLATTNWAVAPLQRILPNVAGFDLASLIPAWLIEMLLELVMAFLRRSTLGNPANVIAGLAGLGALELVSTALMLLMGLVIVGAILSWVSPYSPAVPIINHLTKPFLQPFRRIVPPIANVDITPLILLLILQLLQYLIQGFKLGLAPMLFL